MQLDWILLWKDNIGYEKTEYYLDLIVKLSLTLRGNQQVWIWLFLYLIQIPTLLDELTTKETQFACHILQRMSDEFRRHNLHILSSVDSIMKPFLLWSAINLTPRLLILVVSGYIEDCENWIEIYESMECPLMINK